MDDREGRWERVRDICADGATWKWWWINKIITVLYKKDQIFRLLRCVWWSMLCSFIYSLAKKIFIQGKIIKGYNLYEFFQYWSLQLSSGQYNCCLMFHLIKIKQKWICLYNNFIWRIHPINSFLSLYFHTLGLILWFFYIYIYIHTYIYIYGSVSLFVFITCYVLKCR